MITLLSSTSCAPCKHAKRLLESKQIPFEYKVVELHDGMELLSEHNIRTVPTLIVPQGDLAPRLVSGLQPIIKYLGET